MAERSANSISTSSPAEYFSIWISSMDELLVVMANDHIWETVLDGVLKNVKLDKSKDEASGDPLAKLIVLDSTPFYFPLQDSSSAWELRKLIRDVLQNLGALGCELVTRSNFSTGHYSAGDWFFRYRAGAGTNYSKMFTIILSGSAKLKFLDAPVDAVTTISERCPHYYTLGIEEHDSPQSCGEYGRGKLELNGMPWCARGKDKLVARVFILGIIYEMEKLGYPLLCTIDVKNTIDSLYFALVEHPVRIELLTFSDYSLVTLDAQNKVRLVNYESTPFLERFRDVTEQHFEISKDFDRSMDVGPGMVHEFQLVGNLWDCGDSSPANIQGRNYLVDVLSLFITEFDFDLLTTMSASFNSSDKSVFIFRKRNFYLYSPLYYMSIGCISFHKELIRISNLSCQIQEELSEIVEASLEDYTAKWSKLTLPGGDTVEFKLEGKPFKFSRNENTLGARKFLVNLIRFLDEKGLSVIASADLSSGSSVDTWFVGKRSMVPPPPPPPSKKEQAEEGMTRLPAVPMGGALPTAPLEFEASEPPPSYDEAVGWQF